MPVVHVNGKGAHRVMLYALSTCGWCRMTKQLLDSLGNEYDYIYVDQTSGPEREKVMREAAVCNPSPSFPTIVIDGGKCITGFREDKIREALGK